MRLPDPGMLARLRLLGVDAQTVRRLTRGPDTLFAPLTPTRECLYSDDPVAEAVREIFCESPFHVRFVRDLLIVSDYLCGAPDVVMGAGETTAVLYRSAKPERRVGSVLDVGCGAGTLALLLARDAGDVVATDVNPRAVAFAGFNATLNGIENIDVRLGSLYEPVAGEQFDLIVSQPPYYPGNSQAYLHGGERGHELAELVLLGAAEHLLPDGKAVIHASWPLDWGLPALPGFRLVERTPGIGEVPGTRHSVVTIERGHGRVRIDVPPERWGA